VSTLNGSTSTVYTAIAGAAAVGGILFNQVYRAIDNLKDDIQRAEASAEKARNELRSDMVVQFGEVRSIFATRGGMIEANKAAIQVLDTKLVEVETQFRAASTVSNLEKQYAQTVLELFKQCGPNCLLPPRVYYPPGPGPGNTNGH
jgi:signal transduction histidine kinase